jgi:hypothetical protein
MSYCARNEDEKHILGIDMGEVHLEYIGKEARTNHHKQQNDELHFD